jgi:hypothetical protein
MGLNWRIFLARIIPVSAAEEYILCMEPLSSIPMQAFGFPPLIRVRELHQVLRNLSHCFNTGGMKCKSVVTIAIDLLH